MEPFGTNAALHFSHCANIFAAFSGSIDLAIKNLTSVGSPYFYKCKPRESRTDAYKDMRKYMLCELELVNYVKGTNLGGRTKLFNWFPQLGQCNFLLGFVHYRKADDTSRSLSASASKKELGMDSAGLKVQGIKIYQTPENEHVKQREFPWTQGIGNHLKDKRVGMGKWHDACYCATSQPFCQNSKGLTSLELRKSLYFGVFLNEFLIRNIS